jgi:hypothetical protein
MYEDKLDGRVSDEFYDSKYAEYKNRLDDLAERIALHNKADISYYEFGRKILELAKNAGNLFEQAYPEEKRELMQFVLSNSTIKDLMPDFTLKQPFFSIAKHSSVDECSAWQACRETKIAEEAVSPYPGIRSGSFATSLSGSRICRRSSKPETRTSRARMSFQSIQWCRRCRQSQNCSRRRPDRSRQSRHLTR